MAATRGEDARTRMVDAAAILLARQGYQATSFSTVLEASGAPRGSIYHHFPDGKDQLIAAALERQTTRVVDELAHLKGLTPVEIVDGFSRNWRAMLLATDYALGCSLLAVTTSAGPGELRNGAGVAFERWITAISELLEEAGVDRTAARSFATLTLTSVEGAVAVSRACHSIEPLDAVVDELRRGASGLGRDSREHSESRD